MKPVCGQFEYRYEGFSAQIPLYPGKFECKPTINRQLVKVKELPLKCGIRKVSVTQARNVTALVTAIKVISLAFSYMLG
jgi:hypothetical protein